MWKKPSKKEGLGESKLKENLFLFLKTALGNLTIQNQVTTSMCEKRQDSSKKSHVLVKGQRTCSVRAVFAGESPLRGVILARLSAAVTRADEEEKVVRYVIEITQI